MNAGLKTMIGVAMLFLCSCQAGRQEPIELVRIQSVDSGQPDKDSVLMPELRAELVRVLQSADRLPASGPPVSPADRPELQSMDGRLNWYYASTGDYDQNGEVNAADLVPLSQHFDQQGPFAFTSLAAVVDGDGNSVINLADVTPIGINFGNVVEGYNIYFSSDEDDIPANAGDSNGPGSQLLGSVGQFPAMGLRKLFSFEPASLDPGFYWVRPFAGGSEGIASRFLQIEPPEEGNLPPVATVNVHEHHVTVGDVLELDASMSSDPDGTELRFDWDLDGDGSYESIDSGPVVSRLWDWQGAGFNQVGLRVLDKQGASDTVTVSVAVHPDVPNDIKVTDGLYPDAVWIRPGGLHPVDAISIDYKPASSPDDDWELLAQLEGLPGLFIHDFSNPPGKELEYGQVYSYRIRTYLQGMQSLEYSKEVIGYSSVPRVKGVTAWKSVRPDFIEVAWNKSSKVDSYLIEYRNLSGGSPSEWTFLLESEFADYDFGHTQIYPEGKGAEYGVDYEYRVKARMDGNTSVEWSNSVIGRRELKPIRNSFATESYGQGIQIGWTTIDYAEDYIIEYRNANGGQPASWTLLATRPATEGHAYWHTATEPPGLEAQADVPYEYRVSARYGENVHMQLSPPDVGMMHDSWVVQGHDLQRSFRSSYPVPDSPELLWTHPGISSHQPSAIFNSDNVLFIGGIGLECLDSDGNILWQESEMLTGELNIGPDGLLHTYVLQTPTSLSAAGDTVWQGDHTTLMVNHNYGWRMLVTAAGDRIAIESLYPVFFGLMDYTGNWRWGAMNINGARHYVALDSMLNIYSASNESGPIDIFGRISDNGSDVWLTETVKIPAFLVTDDDNILLGNSQLELYSPDGSLIWTAGIQQAYLLALGWDGMLYCVSNDIHALDSNGNILWTRESEATASITSIVVDGNGTLITSDRFGILTAWDTDGNVRWSRDTMAFYDMSISSDGKLFCRDYGSNLYVYGE